MSTKNYRASLILGAFGDTLGYRNGQWEFCYKTDQIHREFNDLGGLKALNLAPYKVSDDTILHLATVRALIEGKSQGKEDDLVNTSKHFTKSFYGDMVGRAPGTTTGRSMAMLKRGQRPAFSLANKTCGGAMRASAIGLRYHREDQLEDLIWCSIEYCCLTHNGPMAYMGSFLNALFTSYAINKIPANQWMKLAIETKSAVVKYIKTRDDADQHMDYLDWIYEFLQVYQDFRFPEIIEDEDEHEIEWDSTYPYFPESYIECTEYMDETYEALSLEPNGSKPWAGSGGLAASMIAYDALLFAIYANPKFTKEIHEQIYADQKRVEQSYYESTWYHAVMAGMLHAGDNDSTGIIIGGWYGALFGARGVTKNQIEELEYLDEMFNLADQLHKISHDL
jgi:ADP-ribosylarginine hydrolase